MRSVAAALASVFLLSCGGSSPSPTPTSPTSPQTPGNPPPNTYSVSGTVRDDKGAPVAGARVSAGCVYCKTGPGFSSTTDASGRFSGRLPWGTWAVLVLTPGFDDYYREGWTVTGDTTLDVVLKPGIMILGRVAEDRVGPLADARVEVLSGPSAGVTTDTGPPGVPGAYSLHLLPGVYRIRVSKDGYMPEEREVDASITVHNVNFTLKWAYGSCLRSVSPVLFDGYRSGGGEETVLVDVHPGRTFTATPGQPWLEVLSEHSGRLTFRILPHPVGADTARTGAIMIRCSESEGQNVWIVQKPDCQITLMPHSDTPAEFPASGGTGKLRVVTGPARCEWKAESTSDWIHTVGVSSWYAAYDNLHFVVAENRTGAPRTGTLIVGETAWTVRQR